ncbi:transposase [Escherichia coli]|uniref:transposase n=1 Tax=Escherichia coli TaxID=562 RepID=UPI000D59A3C6|nr:transposase [Escherichia coli]
MSRSAKPRKRKPAPQRSKLPRYVVKLHDDDFFDEEDAEALRFDNFDDAVECCADLNIPFFVDAGNKKLVFCGMYCPECGTVHWPDGVPPPF